MSEPLAERSVDLLDGAMAAVLLADQTKRTAAVWVTAASVCRFRVRSGPPGRSQPEACPSRAATKSGLRCKRDVAAELKMTQTISFVPTLANPNSLFGVIADTRDA